MIRTLTIPTPGRGFIGITGQVAEVVAESGVREGLCTVFIRHTSASLLIQENVDPTVRRDFDAFFARLVRDGDPLFHHNDEGPDDMPAHIRAALTATTLSIPIDRGKLVLGTWQGVYLWEHRTSPHTRSVVVQVLEG